DVAWFKAVPLKLYFRDLQRSKRIQADEPILDVDDREIGSRPGDCPVQLPPLRDPGANDSHLSEGSVVSPSLRVGQGVAERVDEDGLGERVELGECLPPLLSEAVRRVEDRRYSPLLRERWKKKPL